jgi:hypothetical protein
MAVIQGVYMKIGRAVFFLGFVFLSGIAAKADYLCTTQSNGESFQATEWDQGSAQSEVIASCQADPYTDNNQCVQATVCRETDGGGGGGYFDCTVTTQGGQYEGTGYNQGQATAAARDQCLQSETSFSCNAGSVVCRQ